MGEIMPCMHHQLAAAPRGCFHEKPACRFPLTPCRLQPTACPHTIRQFLSLYTSEAISLSLPPFFIPSLSPSDEREGSADWRLAVCASTLPSVEVRQSHSWYAWVFFLCLDLSILVLFIWWSHQSQSDSDPLFASYIQLGTVCGSEERKEGSMDMISNTTSNATAPSADLQNKQVITLLHQ